MLNQPCPVPHASRSRMVKNCESSLYGRGVIVPLARGAATPFADDAVEVTAARQLLAARLGVRPESVALVYGGHGKPALAPRYATWICAQRIALHDVAVYALQPDARSESTSKPFV